MLASLIVDQRVVLMESWRDRLRQLDSARHLDQPTLNDHIPLLLDELASAFRRNMSDSRIESHITTPPEHGLQRLEDGFAIDEVVAEYNILRACIHDLADDNGLSLQGKPFHILNQVLDGAIGAAVQSYATQRALDVQTRREDYLAFVAHDLRTPLSAISLAARVLELSVHDPAKAKQTGQMLKTLHRNVQHLSSLVANILDESTNLQTGSGVTLKCRHFDLWPLVEALIIDLHPVAGTGSTRLLNEVPEDQTIYADANLLRRVLQNLIANAIHYTPHGDVTISAGPAGDGLGIECTVSDTGSGIAADLLDKVFDKFESDPANGSGMGLGLAIVKTFVEAHGGLVGVDSVPGRGSVFRITLPNH
ncbi:HAMP domain-containing sensor histidine kinase [Actimicrobium sp. CCC2.4]|uniref:sensor histidine kinase n=1 Tax=Actimicrobium sp. CCC2.4 TaxID=3048606 RepID=UPI002AC9BCEF|nr:HAMP domain-containing sensor histidine kinase [Actimicrobium sp. CCC2.4]MEB0136349.1 HAMP domain-containing sensor histidine kinase [Actimicrobium sp. CCC2.4]WPX31169.1 HAMP domain-containing sensor histidine kinase [Actimicrobium sp. CCC2.4]